MNDNELRDHFAGLAMQRFVGAFAKDEKFAQVLRAACNLNNINTQDAVASMSYDFANAMMKARSSDK